MRICVLGAFGTMGRAVVQEVLQQSDADVVAADIRVQPAEAVFPRHARRLHVVTVDAARPETLKEALSGARVAISCIGPFSRYGVAVARAILENGCHGVDLCNDSVATAGILALDGLARARGLSYITGAGSSPGLTNLLAMQAAGSMDRRAHVHVHLALHVDAGCSASLLEHFMSLSAEDVPVFRNRTHVRVEASGEEERVNFPHPLGRLRVFQMGHPEVFTLPEHLDVEEVWVKGALLPAWLKWPLQLAVSSGIARDEMPRRKLAQGILGMRRLPGGSPVRKNLAIRVDVVGWKKGTPLQVGLSVVDSISRATSLMAVAAATAILSGDVVPAGVFPPEGALPEDRILLHLARQGLVFHREERYL